MKLYNFNRLIDKYSVDLTLVTKTEGKYINNRYVDGETIETAIRGAFVPISENKIYQSGGAYTNKDYNLIMKVPIEQPLETAKVVYKGNEYSLEQQTNYEEYADVYLFAAKWVGAVSD